MAYSPFNRPELIRSWRNQICKLDTEVQQQLRIQNFLCEAEKDSWHPMNVLGESERKGLSEFFSKCDEARKHLAIVSEFYQQLSEYLEKIAHDFDSFSEPGENNHLSVKGADKALG